MKRMVWGVVIALTSLVGGSAIAQRTQATSPPPAQPTYKSLLTQGYEIKAVMLVNSDVATRVAPASPIGIAPTLLGWSSLRPSGLTLNQARGEQQ